MQVTGKNMPARLQVHERREVVLYLRTAVGPRLRLGLWHGRVWNICFKSLPNLSKLYIGVAFPQQCSMKTSRECVGLECLWCLDVAIGLYCIYNMFIPSSIILYQFISSYIISHYIILYIYISSYIIYHNFR